MLVETPLMLKANEDRQFGDWTALRGGIVWHGAYVYWKCRCVCGMERSVLADSLLKGVSKGCGRRCPKKIWAGKVVSGQPEYRAWGQMCQRCLNEKSAQYVSYGAKGITVCDRWRGRGGFLNFIADMGPRPTPKHTIDRIDNAKGYEPSNCRWATRKEQTLNRNCTRLVEYQGRSMTVYDWAKEVGIHKNTLDLRLQNGWTPEEALTTPPTKHVVRIEYQGRKVPLPILAAQHNLDPRNLSERLRRGWTLERALNQKVRVVN